MTHAALIRHLKSTHDENFDIQKSEFESQADLNDYITKHSYESGFGYIRRKQKLKSSITFFANII